MNGNCINGQSRTVCSRSWSRVALLRMRSIDPDFGDWTSALNRSLILDASTTFERGATFRRNAHSITDRLVLSDRTVVEQRSEKLGPRALCRVPANIALRSTRRSYLYQTGAVPNTANGVFHPMMYALTNSSRQLAQMDLLTGQCKYLTLSTASSMMKYQTLTWAKHDSMIVVLSSRPHGTEPLGMVLFNVVPFRLVCVLRVDRSSAFKCLHDMTVQGDVLILEHRVRWSTKPTLHCYNLSQFLQTHAVAESHAQDLLKSTDLFTEDLCEGLPETVQLSSWPEADLVIPGCELEDVSFADCSPTVYLTSKPMPAQQSADFAETDMHILFSVETASPARYIAPAQPFVSNGTFEDEDALLVSECHLLLYISSKAIEVLQYSCENTNSSNHCYVRFIHKIVASEIPDEERWATYWNTPRMSGRLVRSPVRPRSEWADYDEGVVKDASVDPNHGILAACLQPKYYNRHGFGNLYDLFTGKLLKSVKLSNWKEDCYHALRFYSDRLVHVQTSMGHRSTVDVFFLTRPAPDLVDRAEVSSWCPAVVPIG